MTNSYDSMNSPMAISIESLFYNSLFIKWIGSMHQNINFLRKTDVNKLSYLNRIDLFLMNHVIDIPLIHVAL